MRARRRGYAIPNSISQPVTVEPRAVSGAAKITTRHALDYVEGDFMNMTNATFQEASVYPKKYSREALLPAVGQHSRAIIPGDDPGDQQLPDRAITKRQMDPHLVRCRGEYL